MLSFMSKGHTIPLLHLTKLIHKHRPQSNFTIFTTPANEPFISASLSSLPPNNVTILSFPFSKTNDDIPQGVESTDQLPSMSIFYSFGYATVCLKPQFETTLENIQKGPNPITFLISDCFLYWTQESASKFNIPRLGFHGMSSYVSSISRVVMKKDVFSGVECEDELIQMPDFPLISVRKGEFDSSYFVKDPQDPRLDFVIKWATANSMSRGLLANSFIELEQPFFYYINSNSHPKSWPVGPFCLAEKPTLERPEKPECIKWLDERLGEGKHVLYVAFGSQAEISSKQLKEIAIGLEKSGVNFIWVLRIKSNEIEIMHVFEERVKEKGLVVRSWVDQREILEHKSVQGFLSHCGWNSTTESICAGVPNLAWPMMAEQHLNAKMVFEEIEIGLRVETCDWSRRGFVKSEGLSKMIKELMEGKMGLKVKKNVKELSEVANNCVEKGGSSWSNLEKLLNELEMEQIANKQKNGGHITINAGSGSIDNV